MNKHYRPAFGILLDMVGDKNLRLPKEAFSEMRASWLNNKIWNIAQELEVTAFVDEVGGYVQDDHIIFLQNNIPLVNLINQPFVDYWHTINDTPDKCSKESLEKVGQVITHLIYNEK